MESVGPSLYGRDLFAAGAAPARGTLADRFTHPPFSVLNAREGWWQTRKSLWIALGIASEIGRGGNLLSRSEETQEINHYRNEELRKRQKDTTPGGGGPNSKHNRGRVHTASLKGGLTYGLTMNPYGGQRPAKREKTRVQGPSELRDDLKNGVKLAHHSTCGLYTQRGEPAGAADCGTSIFDPVLCELAYRWFSPVGGQILDPFAGGSVRGIVAGMLKRRYWGGDLSAEQIAANRQQATDILGADNGAVEWVVGDSCETLRDAAPDADLLFSCPPYGDLEIYSKHPADLSNMSWPDFRAAYWEIIQKSCDKLRDDRFACFVVGDFRGPDGAYRNFPGDTIRAFQKAGLKLYNEAILVTAVGSLSIRTERQMFMSGKLGRTHQNVLVFVKGDPVRATDAVTGTSETERRDELKRRTAERKRAAETEWGRDPEEPDE